MKIDIAKNDLWWLRELIRDTIWKMENCPSPAAWSKMPDVGRKVYKKIVQAQIKSFGHDWNADRSYYPKSNIKLHRSSEAHHNKKGQASDGNNNTELS